MHDDTIQPPQIYCSQCGRRVPDKRFCMYCGSEIARTVTNFHGYQDTASQSRKAEYSPEIDISEGTRLGDYTIRKRIGSGGFGVVYSAYHQFTDGEIAVKLIPIDSQMMVGAIKNEFSIRRKITDFTNIVRAWQPAAVSHQGRELLVYPMELMPHNISDKTPRDAKDLNDEWLRTVSKDLFPGICAGIAQCHRHGILHLDIKPSNVLLDSAGNPKVTDFGISATPHTDSSTGSAGTIGYAAPEQLDGGHLDDRTDIYALGVLLLELTTGARDTLAYESLSAKHPHLGDVIDRCTRHIPSRRYQSVDEILSELDSEENSRETFTEEPSALEIRVQIYAPFHKLNQRRRQKEGLAVFSRRSVEEWLSITSRTARHYYTVPRIKRISDTFRGGTELAEREVSGAEIVPPGMTISPHRRSAFLAIGSLIGIATLCAAAFIGVQIAADQFTLFSWASIGATYSALFGFLLLVAVPMSEARENRGFTLHLSRIEIATRSGTIGPLLIRNGDATRIKRELARGFS